MSDPTASPKANKKEKKKKPPKITDKKKKKGEKDGDSSSEAEGKISTSPSKEVLAPPQVVEPSAERIEFESLFRRILHDEIADNRLAFALCMINFGLHADDLIGIWMKLYIKANQDEKSGLRPPVKNPLPLRQLQFLREWVTTFQPVFSQATCDELFEVMKEGRDPEGYTAEFKGHFQKFRCIKDAVYTEPAEPVGIPGFPKMNSVPISLYLSIMGLDAEKESITQPLDLLAGASAQQIARQLTALEWQLFKAIRSEELVGLTWAKRPEQAPNVLNMTTQFNRVSYWVATEIVLTNSARDQASLVKKFVQVCKECLALNNFNTLMEILSGLNHVAVQRLKRMWEKVPASVMNLYTSFEDIMTTQQNFSNYREKLAACTPPVVPYLGVYLKDMTFIYDGNLKYNEDGRINFDLFNLVYERWKEMRNFQSAPYSLLEKLRYDQMFETLGAYDHHNEDLLYETSLQAQPSIWANNPASGLSSSLSLGGNSTTELELELEKDSHKDLRTNLSDSFRESDDAKTDSNSDELTSPASAKNKRKTSLVEAGTESDDSSSNAGPRQRRHAVKAVVKEKDALVTVKVPPSQVKTYIKAELVVDRYFAHCYQSKKFGTIEIFDQRYLLLRAPSLSVDFVTTIHKDLEWLISQADATKFAQKLLFDFAFTLGKSDARNFAEKMKSEGKSPSPLTLVCAEPMNLSYLGWSATEIHKGMVIEPSNPKEFYMCFDRTYSFEASAWQEVCEEKKTEKPKHAICTMSCGYASGWTSEALGSDLITVEVLCKAKGDPTCTFITGHSEKIESYLSKYCSDENLSRAQKKVIHVPDLNMVGKKDKKKTKTATLLLKKSSPKAEKKEAKIKAAAAPEAIEPLELPAFKPDDKTMQNINRMQRIQLKGTKLAFSLFSQRNCDTTRGTVEVNQEPYVFLRAKAMSVEFFPLIQTLYPTGEKEAATEFATKFLLDFGISLGKADYKHYITKMGLTQTPPTYHVLALPRILAELGWGQMDIDFKTARLTQTERKVFLRYKVKRSAEAMAWKEERKTNPKAVMPTSPVCIMHCGYMNGYVTECFSDKAELAVVEVCCEGRGDLYCEFLVAHRQRLHRYISGYYVEKELPAEKIQTLQVMRLLEKRSKQSKKAIKADNWGF